MAIHKRGRGFELGTIMNIALRTGTQLGTFEVQVQRPNHSRIDNAASTFSQIICEGNPLLMGKRGQETSKQGQNKTGKRRGKHFEV